MGFIYGIKYIFKEICRKPIPSPLASWLAAVWNTHHVCVFPANFALIVKSLCCSLAFSAIFFYVLHSSLINPCRNH